MLNKKECVWKKSNLGLFCDWFQISKLAILIKHHKLNGGRTFKSTKDFDLNYMTGSRIGKVLAQLLKVVCLSELGKEL